MGMGCPPQRGEIVLSLAALNHIIEHAPHDQTVTVEAGLPLATLQEHLARTGQWLALDPPLRPGATVGGLIATAVAGPRRLRYGGVRDQILGVQVALADGTLARGGGKVVKNVAGYDLPKLFTGALGTLGVVLSASFRLYPLPADSQTLICAAPALEPLCNAAQAVAASTLTPTAIDLLSPASDGQPYRLVARFQSRVERAVTEQLATLRALLGALAEDAEALHGSDEAAFWQALDTPSAHDVGASWLDARAALLPGEVMGWLAALRTTAARDALSVRWRAHAGHGAVRAHLAGQPDALLAATQTLRKAAEDARGALRIVVVSGVLPGAIPSWGAPSALDLMRRVKAQFDPHNTLNPGRYVGGI
jgi:glycolate oxidase FAD binding subunit